MNKLVTIVIDKTKPQPGGSKTGFAYKVKATGKHRVSIVDANKNAKPWKEVVRSVAREYWGDKPPRTDALRVDFTYVLRRPKSHYGTGRNAGKLKPSAPIYPTVKPDVLKLTRSTEDALTKLVYLDDSIIVDENLRKRYGDEYQTTIDVYEMD